MRTSCKRRKKERNERAREAISYSSEGIICLLDGEKIEEIKLDSVGKVREERISFYNLTRKTCVFRWYLHLPTYLLCIVIREKKQMCIREVRYIKSTKWYLY